MEPIQSKYIYPYAPTEETAVEVYPLTEEGIEAIPEEIVHGNYRIGVLGQLFGSFYVKYIGRADHGLKNRVRDHLTDFIKDLIDKNPGRVYFSFNEENNELDAYHQECRDYHDFDPDLNDYHPAKPSGTVTVCKICRE